MTGTLDATGEVVDVNYGFTATSVSPAILFGSVKGKVESSKADYIAKSDRQFDVTRSEEHTSELQSLMRISYAVFCLKKKKYKHNNYNNNKKLKVQDIINRSD